ncbi:MAG: hypothetical protein JRJ03_00495 [Deltaproteobacteria bacterium]|nr:hypothetical protein [Deltaproteobacteria bacterium]
MEFTLAGKKFNFSKESVSEAMYGIEPEVLRKHAVKINDTLYPCKQVISVVTGLSRADFNSHQAHQILKRTGLEVVVNNNG